MSESHVYITPILYIHTYIESDRQLLTAQRVGARLYSQAQIASRPRNQKLANAQAVRKLASELRSIARAQELSNEQQRAEWKTILSELQEIQKNK